MKNKYILKRANCKKCMDNEYKYLLTNKFDYFVTLGFSPDKVDPFDIDVVMKLFCDFRQGCKRKHPDCEIFAIPERNARGALHFHVFMSNIDLRLTPALDKDGKAIKDGFDNIVYNVDIWNLGYATATLLPKDDSYNRVIKYLMK